MAEQQQTSSNFKSANLQQALNETAGSGNRIYKGKEISPFGPLAHLKIYGSGIYLFFKFMKYMTVVLFIMSLVSLGPICFNSIYGNTFRNSPSSLAVFMTQTSVGSFNHNKMTSTSAASESLRYKGFNVGFDLANCLIFLVFCLFWEYKSRKIAGQIHEDVKLQSKMTVEVVSFPAKVNEGDIKKFMQQFGDVHEVVTINNYSKQIQIAKQIASTEKEIKQLTFEQIDLPEEKKAKIQEKIGALKKEVKELQASLDSIVYNQRQVIKFLVLFESIEEAQTTLQYFKKYQTLFSCRVQKPDNISLNGTQIQVVPCNTEPSGIIWENAHMTWRQHLPRHIIQTIIILIVLFGGFLAICFLNVTIPGTDTDQDISGYTYDTMLLSTDTSIQETWCIKHFDIDFSSSPYYSGCYSYWRKYMISIVVSVCISIILMIISEIINAIIAWLADFMKFRTITERSVSTMTNLFVMDFVTSTLITFLMQANIFNLSVLDFIKSMITEKDLLSNVESIDEYSDLTPGWYKDIGYQIWLNLLVMCVLPHIYMPLSYYAQEKFALWQAKRQRLHDKAVEKLKLPQFEIEDHCSNLMTILATGMIFGGGIQLLMPITFICFLGRYFYLRYIFVRYCETPPVYNEYLNTRVIRIMKIVLVCRMIISIYMYGASSVFARQRSTFMEWADTFSIPVIRSVLVVISRIAETWYYALVSLLFIVFLGINKLVYVFIDKCKERRLLSEEEKAQKKALETEGKVDKIVGEMMHVEGAPDASNGELFPKAARQLFSEGSEMYGEARSQKNVVKSYRIEKNADYTELLSIIKRRIGQKQRKQEIDPNNEVLPENN